MAAILIIAFVWYVISQLLAEAIISFGVEPPTVQDRSSIRFMAAVLPLFLLMALLAFAEWHVVRFANLVGFPLVGPAKDNPWDHIP